LSELLFWVFVTIFSRFTPLVFLLLAASRAAAVDVRLNVFNRLFYTCFFEIYTVCFSMFDRIFLESASLLVLLIDS
jgi:hypothetical protein